jgi:hypothetical protein
MSTFFSSGISIPTSIKNSFTDLILHKDILSKLSVQQQKIAIVASIAIGVIAVIFITFCCCLKKKVSRRPAHSPVQGGLNVGNNKKSPSAPLVFTYSPTQGHGNQGGIPNVNRLSPSLLGMHGGAFPGGGVKLSPSQDPLGKMYGGVGVKPLYPDLGGIQHDSHKHKVRELSEVEKIESTISELRKEIEYEQQLLDVLKDTTPQFPEKQLVVEIPKSDETKKDDGATQQSDQPVVDIVVGNVLDAEKDQKNEPTDKVFLGIEEDSDIGDPYGEAQLRILALTSELNEALGKYPKILRLYLEDQYKHRKDNNDIFERITMLQGFLEVYKPNEDFVEEALKEIDLFLTNAFFTTADESCLPEEKKIDLVVFHVFFTILNEHIDAIQARHPQLALNLKVKLANLPLHNDINRTAFSNIYLSERKQLDILVHHFYTKEAEAVDLAILFLKNSLAHFSFTTDPRALNEKDVKRLAKFVTQNLSPLEQKNVNKIRNALQDLMGKKVPDSWNDYSMILRTLNDFFNIRPTPVQNRQFYQFRYLEPLYQQNPKGINALHLACKARRFFQDQLGKPKHEILIPRWYHATDYANLEGIIKSTEIQVRHRQAFEGAWVSTQREPTMGDCTLIFTHCVSQIDPDVIIQYEKGNEPGKVRWRGLQKSIPLNGVGNKPTLAYVGLRNVATKEDKEKIIKLLKEKNIPVTTIFTNELVDYIHREILRMIGNPNLTEKWWGKATLDSKRPSYS